MTQGTTGYFNSHRCGLGSNDDILIPHDHRSPEIPFVPFGVVEVGNVRTVRNRKSGLGSNYETA